MAEIRILRERLLELKEYYRPLRNRWQEDHEFYAGTFKIELPEGTPKRIPPTGRNAIDIPKSHLISDKPVVKRRTESDKKNKSSDDDDAEAFMVAYLQENERLAETPPLHEGFKLQLLRGGAVRKGPFFNLTKWQKNQKAGKVIMPDYLWHDMIDPWNVFIEPGPNPRQVFFERSITVAEIETKFEGDVGFDASTLTGKDRSARLVLVEWYGFEDEDSERCTYAAFVGTDEYMPVDKIPLIGDSTSIEGEWIIAPRNSYYRYLPAKISYSGYGIRTEGAAPEGLWESILNSQIKSMLTDQAHARSLASAAVARIVLGRWQTPNPDSLDKMKLDPNGATISFVPSDVIPMPAEQFPPNVFENEDKANARLEEGLFSGVVGGQRPKGVDTASGLAILAGTGRLKFGAPLGMAENGVDALLFDLCLLMEDIADLMGSDTEFEMRGRKLRAGQLHGDYAFSTTLLNEDPTEQNQKIATGLSLAASPYAPSIETIWSQYFGIEDVAGELKRKLKGDIILAPEFAQVIKNFLGLAQYKVAEEARAKQMPQGSNMDVVKQLNSMAAMYRAGRPGGLEQQKPLPGTVEEMAGQVASGPGWS